MTYEKITQENGPTFIKRTDDEGNVAWIPENLENGAYLRYLEWLAEGNEPAVPQE